MSFQVQSSQSEGFLSHQKGQIYFQPWAEPRKSHSYLLPAGWASRGESGSTAEKGRADREAPARYGKQPVDPGILQFNHKDTENFH